MARIDPLLYSYQTAISSLMENQQVAQAAFLAASAMAHLPIQPAISPLESPKLPPNLGVSVRPRHRRAVRMLPVGQVEQQQQLYRQRLRFILEGQAQQCHARVERVESRGKLCQSCQSRHTLIGGWSYGLGLDSFIHVSTCFITVYNCLKKKRFETVYSCLKLNLVRDLVGGFSRLIGRTRRRRSNEQLTSN